MTAIESRSLVRSHHGQRSPFDRPRATAVRICFLRGSVFGNDTQGDAAWPNLVSARWTELDHRRKRQAREPCRRSVVSLSIEPRSLLAPPRSRRCLAASEGPAIASRTPLSRSPQRGRSRSQSMFSWRVPPSILLSNGSPCSTLNPVRGFGPREKNRRRPLECLRRNVEVKRRKSLSRIRRVGHREPESDPSRLGARRPQANPGRKHRSGTSQNRARRCRTRGNRGALARRSAEGAPDLQPPLGRAPSRRDDAGGRRVQEQTRQPDRVGPARAKDCFERFRAVS